jgi:hypothetical protein
MDDQIPSSLRVPLEIPMIGESDRQSRTLRTRVKLEVMSNVRTLMNDIKGDDKLNAEIVAAGPFHFRQAFAKDMGAFWGKSRAGCDILANVVFRFAAQQWELKSRHRLYNFTPAAFLNALVEVSEPTQEEIDNAWEIDVGSSEGYMAKHWEGSARHRKGHLRELGARTRAKKKA